MVGVGQGPQPSPCGPTSSHVEAKPRGSKTASAARDLGVNMRGVSDTERARFSPSGGGRGGCLLSLQGAKQWSRVAMSRARGERAGHVLSEPRGAGSLPSLARVISYPGRGWCQEGPPVTCCETFLSSSAFLCLPLTEGPMEQAGLGRALPRDWGLASVVGEWQPRRPLPGSCEGSQDEILLEVGWALNLMAAVLTRERRGELETQTHGGEAAWREGWGHKPRAPGATRSWEREVGPSPGAPEGAGPQGL